MSIPALGGGAHQALQRALREATERATSDELGILDGEDPAAATGGTGAGTAGGASAGSRVRRRAAADPAGPQQLLDDVVELGESANAERLEVAGGWITTVRRGPLETKGVPQPRRFGGGDIKTDADIEDGGDAAETVPAPGTPTPTGPAGRAAAGQAPSPGATVPPGDEETQVVGPGSARPDAPERAGTPGQAAVPGIPGQAGKSGQTPRPGGPTAAPTAGTADLGDASAAEPERASEGITLDRLIAVLKKTGIDFRDAYQVLREIHAGEPLPPRAELRARWAAADPGAWEEHAASSGTQGRQPTRTADPDLRQTPVDDIIRDRAWHRANAVRAAEAETGTADGATEEIAGRAAATAAGDDRAGRPTLQTITRPDVTNQAYLAGLSTAEFQRLVTVLGRAAPDWFWDVRGHRGLRGLAERPVIARLNTTRIAGTRLGAWILAMLGMAMLWYIGLHTNVWW